MCTMYISLKAIIIVILRFTQKFNYILFFIFILWLPNKDELLNIKPIKLSHSPHENTWLQISPSICLLTFFLSKSLRQKAFKTNNTSVGKCTLPCLDLKSLFKKKEPVGSVALTKQETWKQSFVETHTQLLHL